MRLAAFIDANTEAILVHWDAYAQTLLPAAAELDAKALRDHAGQILRAVAIDLQKGQSDAEQSAKSRGQAPRDFGAPETAAETHAVLRAADGFTMQQLVGEYRVLRATVLRLFSRAHLPRHDTLDDITRFNEAIDQAIAESVDFFTIAQKQTEALVRRGDERYRRLFDSMDQGYCVIEMIFDAAERPVNWRFLEVNPAFEKHNGLHNAVGRTILDLAPNIETSWFDVYGGVSQTGESKRFVNESKALGRWFDLYAFRVGGDDGTHVAVLFTDITDRKRAEAERERLVASLQEQDERKDQFLATLAHELRNPLAPIRNALHLLTTDGGAENAERWHEMLDRQVGHLVRLVDDLMDASRINRGELRLRREPLELAEVLRTAVESSQPLIDHGQHNLSVSVSDQSLRVDGDAVRLAQVFANLLNNAAKYTDNGGRIELTAQVDGDCALVSVRDNGIGVAPDELPRLFKMFAQIDPGNSRAQGGLGIGLNLAQRLVQMHGGSIHATSAGVGHGSLFSVRLPLAHASAVVVETKAAPFGFHARRLLVVDDNRDAADSLGMLLELLGAEVRIEHDGASALATATAWRPSAVLLDLSMPRMDGFEVARRLRSDPTLSGLKLIALTGLGQESDRSRTRAANFDHHLIKPVDVEVLRTLLVSGTAT